MPEYHLVRSIEGPPEGDPGQRRYEVRIRVLDDVAMLAGMFSGEPCPSPTTITHTCGWIAGNGYLDPPVIPPIQGNARLYDDVYDSTVGQFWSWPDAAQAVVDMWRATRAPAGSTHQTGPHR